MTCYRPHKWFRSVEKHHRTGNAILTRNPLKAINSTNPIHIPCQKCDGCLHNRAQDWATRLMHEAQMHEHKSFITFTYDDEHLPEDYSVNKRDWQLFMKRYRKELLHKVRFFMGAEYGPRTFRPHYHAIIFGHAFTGDRKFFRTNEHGDRIYTSETLNRIWGLGNCEIGDVTYRSARYVAGYVTKKITSSDKAAAHYLRTHPRSGQVYQVEKEFQLQSTVPGIGSSWFDKYKDDCFPSDFVVIEGRQMPVPRFYLLKLQEEERLKIQRQRKLSISPSGVKTGSSMPGKKANRTTERLRVREEVFANKIARLSRNNIEENNDY